MYIVPEPKEIHLKDNNLYTYDMNISIDKKCSYNIFLAAKDL